MAYIVGKPPIEDYYMGKATERIFLPLFKMQHPKISEEQDREWPDDIEMTEGIKNLVSRR